MAVIRIVVLGLLLGGVITAKRIDLNPLPGSSQVMQVAEWKTLGDRA
jgi:hypothetical protein